MAEHIELQTISASRLKSFRICQRQYYYKYILNKDDRPEQNKNIGALLGTALHKAIERKYRNNDDPIKIFQQVMQETFEEWELADFKILGEEWYSKSLKDGRKILNETQWNNHQPIELELAFTLPFPNEDEPIVFIQGIIDHVDLKKYIIDHKSQTKLPSEDERDNDPQFIIYYWAYKQLYGEFPTAIYWNHLRTNEFIPVNVAYNYDLKIKQLEYDIRALIEGREYYPRRMLDNKVCKRECSFFTLCYGAKVSE